MRGPPPVHGWRSTCNPLVRPILRHELPHDLRDHWSKDADLYRLEERIEYQWGDWLIALEPGFVTDYASIPTRLPLWLLRWLGVPRSSKYGPGALLHDAGCQFDLDRFGEPGLSDVFDVEEWNLIFLWANLDSRRVTPWAAYRMYRMVSWFCRPEQDHDPRGVLSICPV